MMSRYRWISLVPILLLAACPPHQGRSRLRSAGDYDDLRDDDDDDDGGGGDSDDSEVSISYDQLPDAVVERNDSGIPRENVDRMREILCEGREGDDVLFYRLVVSKHWHYYWLCSESRARRISSPYGNRHATKWLKGFKRRARALSDGCQAGASKPLLRGTHESGVRAVAFCDGRIVLRFPDGGKTIKSFGGGQRVASSASVPRSCPSCPICPRVGSRECPDCPQPRPCPPPRVCPRCPPPPKCDCKPSNVEAGRKGFWMGVNKACKRICILIYKKCRSIDPKTAMCHMLSEYCKESCASAK
jgi:hypothetical protein